MNQAILAWSFRQPCDFKASLLDLVVKVITCIEDIFFEISSLSLYLRLKEPLILIIFATSTVAVNPAV